MGNRLGSGSDDGAHDDGAHNDGAHEDGPRRRAHEGRATQVAGLDAEHRGSTTWEGFAVLGHAIRREPAIFVLSTIGSVLFAVLTVADAWVLGWATDHVVIPAFETGEISAGLLWAVLGLFMGVAILRAVGIVARRLGAGVMQYRM